MGRDVLKHRTDHQLDGQRGTEHARLDADAEAGRHQPVAGTLLPLQAQEDGGRRTVVREDFSRLYWTPDEHDQRQGEPDYEVEPGEGLEERHVT